MAEGDYKIRVEKATDNGEWVYQQIKSVFIGADTRVKLEFELGEKIASAKRKQRIKKQEKSLAWLAKTEKIPKTKDRYIDNGNGTITDKTTKLMWKTCSEGQTYDKRFFKDATCQGEADKYQWQQAIDHAKGVTFAKHNDWRLPTIDELHTLVVCSSDKRINIKRKQNGAPLEIDGKSQNGKCIGKYNKPTINQVIFPSTPASHFWSASPNSNYSITAWLLYFDSGGGGGGGRNGSSRVRLVRSGE